MQVLRQGASAGTEALRLVAAGRSAGRFRLRGATNKAARFAGRGPRPNARRERRSRPTGTIGAATLHAQPRTYVHRGEGVDRRGRVGHLRLQASDRRRRPRRRSRSGAGEAMTALVPFVRSHRRIYQTSDLALYDHLPHLVARRPTSSTPASVGRRRSSNTDGYGRRTRTSSCAAVLQQTSCFH